MKKIIIMSMLGLSVLSCKNDEKEAQVRAQQATIDSLRMEAWKQHVADSVAQAQQLQQQQVSYESNVSTPRTYYGHSPKRSYSTPRSAGGTAPAATSPADNTATTQQKKGWSAKAKGAVIGAGAGAITGAMVDKRKGEGAIIGGILGAGAGLGTGAIIDKKQKEKQQQQQQQK